MADAEGALILLCARTELADGVEERLRTLVASPLDWERVHRLAIRHGTLPMLYRHLAATCAPVMPVDVMTTLRARYEYNSLRNLTLTAELLRLLDALERSGIEALAYKGPTLAAQAYGNLAHRQFGDLDVLVRPQHAARAVAVLRAEGYDGSPWPSPDQDHLRRKHAHRLHRSAADVELELHWALMPRDFSFAPDLGRWWGRLVRWPLGRGSVLALPAEELLVVLCAHGCKHLWVRLKSVCDVAALVGAHELDWSRVFAEASVLGARRMVALGVFLAHDLLGAPLPADVRVRVVADTAVPPLAADVRARLFERDMVQPASAAAQRFYLRSRERWREKVRHAVRYADRAYHEWRRGTAAGTQSR